MTSTAQGRKLLSDFKKDGPAPDLLRNMYRSMVMIRRCEEAVADLVEAGEIKTPCHLCIGQEAVPAGVCAALERSDTVWGAHRSHGHYLAKGGSLQKLMAEIFCRESGCSGGRGGSMHVCAPAVGVMGTVPIVAATIPLAVGAAFAEKLRDSGGVAVSFFGDGATEEGHFHEALNLAALNQLPVIFVCENNLYSSHMGILERRTKDSLPELGKANGVTSLRVDGNDAIEVYRATEQAVQRARAREGPTFLECRTFRWRGHVGPSWDMDVGVKRKDELAEWLQQDPIRQLSELLLTDGISQRELDELQSQVNREIEAAICFARESPPPALSQLERQVYKVAA